MAQYRCWRSSNAQNEYNLAYDKANKSLASITLALNRQSALFESADSNNTVYNNLVGNLQSRITQLTSQFNLLPSPSLLANITLCCPAGGSLVSIKDGGAVCSNCPIGQFSYIDDTTGEIKCNPGYGCENVPSQRGRTTNHGYSDNRLMCVCPAGYAWSSLSKTCISVLDVADTTSSASQDMSTLGALRTSSIYEGTALDPAKQTILTPTISITTNNNRLNVLTGTNLTTAANVSIPVGQYTSVDSLLNQLQTSIRSVGVLGSLATIQMSLQPPNGVMPLVTIRAGNITPVPTFKLDNTLLARQLGFRNPDAVSSNGNLFAMSSIGFS